MNSVDGQIITKDNISTSISGPNLENRKRLRMVNNTLVHKLCKVFRMLAKYKVAILLYFKSQAQAITQTLQLDLHTLITTFLTTDTSQKWIMFKRCVQAVYVQKCMKYMEW